MRKVVSDCFDVGESRLHEVDNGYVWNWVSLRVKIPGKSSSLAIGVDVGNKGTIQVDGNAPCAEVIDSQNTTDNISAHFIKHENLPNGIAIFIQDRSGMRDKTASGGLIEGSVVSGLRVLIEVQ